MPDDRLGHVNRAVTAARAEGREIDVDYVLATDPGTRHHGTVKEIHEQAEVRGEAGNTVLVRVTIDPSRHEKEELGAGATVTARAMFVTMGWFEGIHPAEDRPSPRRMEDVDVAVLEAAVVEADAERHVRALGRHAELGAHVHQHPLDASHMVHHGQRTGEPHDRIAHQLPRPVPCDLAASIDIDYRRPI